MASLITMFVPFVLIGIIFVVGALLWTRYKGGEVSKREIGSEELKRGGNT